MVRKFYWCSMDRRKPLEDLSRGETSDLRCIYSWFHFLALMGKSVLTFFSGISFGETSSFKTSFPKGWGLASLKTEKSSDNTLRHSN